MFKSGKIPPHWTLAPVYSRGQFSPRLLMAWQAFYFSCWLAGHYVLTPATVVNVGTKTTPIFQLVQAVNPLELVLGGFGLVGLLLGLGTLQKNKLGDLAPAPGETASEAEKKEAAAGATATLADVDLNLSGKSAAENTE